MTATFETAPVQHDMDVVRGFVISSLVWEIVGMLVGLIIACQLAWPELNLGPYFHFGRFRPTLTRLQKSCTN